MSRALSYTMPFITKVVDLSQRVGTTRAAALHRVNLSTLKSWRQKLGVRYRPLRVQVTDYIAAHPQCTAREIALAIPLHGAHCSNILYHLKRHGVIAAYGRGRAMRYTLVADAFTDAELDDMGVVR